MDPIALVLIILVVAVVAFATNAVPLEVTAIGVSLALYLTGVLDLPDALAGFGDPTVLFIIALFIVSEALESSGVIAWAGQAVLARAGTRHTSLLIVLCLLTALVTALISMNASVAALLPLVVVVATRAGIAPSRMLLPLAFSAHAGSMLALTGTPVNILVSDAAEKADGRPFGFFEFALAGLPLLLGTVALIAVLGPRLLPERPQPSLPVDVERLTDALRRDYGLALAELTLDARRGVAEVIIPPRSPMVGTHVFPGMQIPDARLVILAARGGEESLNDASFTLRAGDSLLLDGAWDDLSRYIGRDGTALAVDHPDRVRRAVPIGAGAKRTLFVTACMLALLITGAVPPAIAALLAAGAIILLRVVTPAQAFRSVSWSVIVLLAGMIPLSIAFQASGAAQLIADGLVGLAGGLGPTAALGLIVVVALVLGQLISNMATVLILIPIATAVAEGFQASPLPFLMGLTVAGAASFLTPIATPGNLMIYEPGQYRFTDYTKFGLPFMALFFAVAVFWVPLIWPFAR